MDRSRLSYYSIIPMLRWYFSKWICIGQLPAAQIQLLISKLIRIGNRLMHVKDMSKKVRFSGDGGNPQQWIELFPYMTTAGSGVIDLKTILPKAKENGVTHFIVEQDMVAD